MRANTKATLSATSFRRFMWVIRRDAFQANMKIYCAASRQAATAFSVGSR